jgi:hypothetical protein
MYTIDDTHEKERLIGEILEGIAEIQAIYTVLVQKHGKEKADRILEEILKFVDEEDLSI